MARIATVESLEMRKRLCCGSMERELHISKKVVQELLEIPKALMERLTKWTDLSFLLRLVKTGAYLFSFLIEFDKGFASKLK